MENKEFSYFKSYVSGFISGVSAILVSHPIDTIKTNYQENKPIKLNFRYLYRGIYAPLLGVGIEKAFVFGTYDEMYKYTHNHFISGGIAGFIASGTITPYERAKILKQMDIKILKETKHPKSYRFALLFQGFTATFYREMPGFAIYFSTYNYLKDKTKEIKQRDITTVESFIYGGLSGAFSWVFIYPQDRVKTHIQSSTTSITFRQGIKNVIKDGGLKGLYRGFQFALLRAIPLHATAFMMNEKCKHYLY